MSSLVQSNPLLEIEVATKAYSKARAVLSERVSALNSEAQVIHSRHRRGIKSALAIATDAQALLRGLIEKNPQLFEKPRTFTSNGIKVGFVKGKGRVDWDDDDGVLKRIAKLVEKGELTEEAAELLILKKTTPSADALRSLDVKLLAKLGVTIEGTGDSVLVAAQDGEVDKLVERILKEGADEPAAAPDAA